MFDRVYFQEFVEPRHLFFIVAPTAGFTMQQVRKVRSELLNRYRGEGLRAGYSADIL